MPENPQRTFIALRLVSNPPEILHGHTNPGDDRGTTIPSAVIAMTIAFPGPVAEKFPSGGLAETMSRRGFDMV